MKTRKGWVSNSSTSSYIIVGCDKLENGDYETYKGMDWDALDELDFQGFEEIMIGRIIVSVSDDIGIEEFDLSAFIKDVEKAKEDLKKLFPNTDESNFKIYSGVFQS